jgi:DDE superfamily endonuclease
MLEFTVAMKYPNPLIVSVGFSYLLPQAGAKHAFVGAHIEYLPPYSPDLNPIEEAFSKIKHFLHHHQDYYLAAIGDGIIYDMYEVMEIITLDDAAGYFMHAGYF